MDMQGSGIFVLKLSLHAIKNTETKRGLCANFGIKRKISMVTINMAEVSFIKMSYETLMVFRMFPSSVIIIIIIIYYYYYITGTQ